MKFERNIFLLATTLFGASTLFAQAPHPISAFEEPNPADFEIAVEESPPSFGQTQTVVPVPEPPTFRKERQTQGAHLDSTPESYRATIEQFSQRKHTFVHCELKNGKVLTGLVRGVSDRGFELATDALAGTYVTYAELAKAPRQVPAVGTRIKHGAEWTGLVLLAAAALPILLPLMLTGVISDC
jgi:hypothetical protein